MRSLGHVLHNCLQHLSVLASGLSLLAGAILHQANAAPWPVVHLSATGPLHDKGHNQEYTHLSSPGSLGKPGFMVQSLLGFSSEALLWELCVHFIGGEKGVEDHYVPVT